MVNPRNGKELGNVVVGKERREEAKFVEEAALSLLDECKFSLPLDCVGVLESSQKEASR